MKMKILIIDDSKEDRYIIIDHIKNIKKGKMDIHECDCLKDGIQKLSDYDFDALILDLGLPESDGLETIETILNHISNSNKNTPVIVLTGLEDYSLGRKAWSLGIKDFLIKDETHQKDISRALTFANLKK